MQPLEAAQPTELFLSCQCDQMPQRVMGGRQKVLSSPFPFCDSLGTPVTSCSWFVPHPALTMSYDFSSQGGFVVCLVCESLFALHPQCDDSTHSLPRCLSTATVLFPGISRCLVLVQNISQTSCCLKASSSRVSLL